MTRRAGLDRATVVEVAVRLVDEDGLEHLSLAHLAERLDVKVPSLYNHVDGLADLKNALTKYCLRELLTHLSHAVMGKARTEAIFALADAVRGYARATPGRYALTLQAPMPNDPEWQELGRQNVEVARAVLTPYALGEEVTIHAIRSLRSIVQGFVSLEMAGAFAIPLDLDTSFHWLIRLYADGLEALGEEDTDDWIIDANGFYVATRSFLIRRGSCCANQCRNCPYINWRNIPIWQPLATEEIQVMRVPSKAIEGARRALASHQQQIKQERGTQEDYHLAMVRHYQTLLDRWEPFNE